MTEFCIHCKETKPQEEFYKSKTTKSGFQKYCKICCKIKTKKWYLANKDRAYENSSRWAYKHRESRILYQRQWRAKQKLKSKVI